MQGPQPRKPHKPSKPREAHSSATKEKIRKSVVKSITESAIRKKCERLSNREKKAEKIRDVKRMVQVLLSTNSKPRNKSELRKPHYSDLLNHGRDVDKKKCNLVFAEWHKLSTA